MDLNNQKGFSLLSFAVILSVLLVTVMYITMGKSAEASKRMGKTMSISFANDLSIKLAQKIRRAYDVAELIAANPANAPLCPAASGSAIIPLSPTVRLCMQSRQICVDHPRGGAAPVCVGPGDGSLLAKRQPRSWWLNEAQAQTPDRPPAPMGTSNTLTVTPTCLDGSCQTTCGVNAACVTYRFCPLGGTCKDEEKVWQTIALLR